MKKKSRDSLPFPLFMTIALAAGVFFFLWGQSNTAGTLFELGFLRYRAEAQLSASRAGSEIFYGRPDRTSAHFPGEAVVSFFRLEPVES